MAEYGIWTENDGGFIETQIYGREEAESRLVQYFEQDPDNVGDLSVVEICPEHEEQPAEGCEECDTEDTQDDEEED